MTYRLRRILVFQTLLFQSVILSIYTLIDDYVSAVVFHRHASCGRLHVFQRVSFVELVAEHRHVLVLILRLLPVPYAFVVFVWTEPLDRWLVPSIPVIRINSPTRRFLLLQNGLFIVNLLFLSIELLYLDILLGEVTFEIVWLHVRLWFWFTGTLFSRCCGCSLEFVIGDMGLWLGAIPLSHELLFLLLDGLQLPCTLLNFQIKGWL